MSGWAQRPTVCAVMLVNGREAMVRRAIASFRAQTYERKRLLILNTGAGSVDYESADDVGVWNNCFKNGDTIGNLRNSANRLATHNEIPPADLIAHWDSDDWSHPRRLEEQVALLEASGKQCVGYRELLFWDTRHTNQCTHAGVVSRDECPYCDEPGDAWIYRNHQDNWAAGASLLYRRELWERQPFDDAPHEDQRWMMTPAVSAECLGISSLDPTNLEEFQSGGLIQRDVNGDCEPRMICQMHGANTEQISRQKMLSNPDVWLRAKEFDEYCERTMQL